MRHALLPLFLLLACAKPASDELPPVGEPIIDCFGPDPRAEEERFQAGDGQQAFHLARVPLEETLDVRLLTESLTIELAPGEFDYDEVMNSVWLVALVAADGDELRVEYWPRAEMDGD